MRRFYRRVIVPLCLSTVFCTMPVHASEAAENAETAAVEAAAEEGENNAEDSIAQFVSTEEIAGDITDSIAVEEGIEQYLNKHKINDVNSIIGAVQMN